MCISMSEAWKWARFDRMSKNAKKWKQIGIEEFFKNKAEKGEYIFNFDDFGEIFMPPNMPRSTRKRMMEYEDMEEMDFQGAISLLTGWFEEEEEEERYVNEKN